MGSRKLPYTSGHLSINTNVVPVFVKQENAPLCRLQEEIRGLQDDQRILDSFVDAFEKINVALEAVLAAEAERTVSPESVSESVSEPPTPTDEPDRNDISHYDSK